MSVADKLITIANNTPLVCERLYTKKTVSGNPVVVDDVSSTEHNLELRVTSKNLITFPYLQSTKKLNGITVTANDDGTISASGTATADTTIYFDLCVKDFGTTNIYSGFAYDNGYAVKDCTYDAGNKKTYISISVKNGEEINNTYYPQIELGSTATPYTPYKTEFEGVEVSRYGKNLISTDNIEVSGTGAWTSKILTKQPLPDGTYTFSCEYENLTENITTIGIVVRDIDEKWIGETYGNNGTIKLTFSTTNGISIYLYSNMGSPSTFTDIIFKNIQLELGSTVTEYEPYKEPQTATANADGIVEGLRSVSPNMTLLADNTVNIECTYKSGSNPTANEKFIELQEAFANAKEIIQKYKIKMEK